MHVGNINDPVIVLGVSIRNRFTTNIITVLKDYRTLKKATHSVQKLNTAQILIFTHLSFLERKKKKRPQKNSGLFRPMVGSIMDKRQAGFIHI